MDGGRRDTSEASAFAKDSLCSICDPKQSCTSESETYKDIMKITMRACAAGATISVNNRRRFCYKNIQHICTKTRDYLNKADPVTANFKCQGVPWTAKEFIFAYLRMLDGWNCLNMVLLEKHDGYRRIENDYYDPTIREAFYEWQACTERLMVELCDTFQALDAYFQRQQHKKTPSKNNKQSYANHDIDVDWEKAKQVAYDMVKKGMSSQK